MRMRNSFRRPPRTRRSRMLSGPSEPESDAWRRRGGSGRSPAESRSSWASVMRRESFRETSESCMGRLLSRLSSNIPNKYRKSNHEPRRPKGAKAATTSRCLRVLRAFPSVIRSTRTLAWSTPAESPLMRFLRAMVLAMLVAPSTLSAQGRMTFLPAGNPPSGAPVVNANDNRTRAGTLENGVLTVRLVVQMSEWRPQAADGPGILVPAFAEEGKQPQIPAPLIRVPRGTRVRTMVRNALPDSIIVRGLAGKNDTAAIRIRGGATYAFETVANSGGTTVYRASTPAKGREEEQLSGAFHVDTAPPRPD